MFIQDSRGPRSKPYFRCHNFSRSLTLYFMEHYILIWKHSLPNVNSRNSTRKKESRRMPAEVLSHKDHVSKSQYQTKLCVPAHNQNMNWTRGKRKTQIETANVHYPPPLSFHFNTTMSFLYILLYVRVRWNIWMLLFPPVLAVDSVCIVAAHLQSSFFI